MLEAGLVLMGRGEGVEGAGRANHVKREAKTWTADYTQQQDGLLTAWQMAKNSVADC